MCLAMLLGPRIIELQGPEPRSSHQKEINVLDIFDIFLGSILQEDEYRIS